MRTPVFVAAILLGLASPAAVAETLRVPSEAYPEIQDAVDAAQAGDTILLAAGVHGLSASLQGKSNLRILGVEGTVIDSSGLYLDGCDDVTLQGFAFVDATDTQVALSAVDCTRLVLKDLRFEGYDGLQVLLASCDGVRVQGCSVVDGTGTGLRAEHCTDLVIQKCLFEDNASRAVVVTSSEAGPSARTRILKNTITGSADGIAASGEDLRIERNTVAAGTGTGILVGEDGDTAGALVRGNAVAVDHLLARGVDVRADASRVSGNGVTGFAGLMVIVKGEGNRIDGNEVTGNGTGGTGIQGMQCAGSDLLVTRNVARGIAGTSFYLTQGSGSTVSKNRALEAGDTGFVLSQSGAQVLKNRAEGAYHGFSLVFSPMTLKGNAAAGSRTVDVISTLPESAFTLSRNRFETFLWNYEPPPLEL